jgi:FixJ family two-component response regulator
MEKVPVQIFTSRAEDIRELNSFLGGTPWELTADRNATAPILLLDRDYSERWQTAIGDLIKLRRTRCVVLLSNVSDQYLWDEMVQHGGFDILTRPFRKEHVLSTLQFAYAHSHAPWPKIAP